MKAVKQKSKTKKIKKEKGTKSSITRYNSYSHTVKQYSPSAALEDYSKSYTEGRISPSATFGEYSKSITEAAITPSSALGWHSKSQTKGGYSPSATLGGGSQSKTKGKESHSATLENESRSYTEGESAFSVAFGYHSLSETKGKETITLALGHRSKIKALDGIIAIVEYHITDEGIVPKIMHCAKIGETILGVTIEPNKWYGFDKEEVFRVFTEEEVYSEYLASCFWLQNKKELKKQRKNKKKN